MSKARGSGEPVLILGLDPGSRHTGYGVLQRRGSRIAAVAQGRLSPPTGGALPDRLAYLGDRVAELIARHRPGLVAVESTFHGPNVRSLIVLAQARGVLLAEAARAGVEVREYSPAEIKSALTGNGRAAKRQVARMVGLLIAAESERWAEDATDAMAVAICCARRYRMEDLLAARAIRKRSS